MPRLVQLELLLIVMLDVLLDITTPWAPVLPVTLAVELEDVLLPVTLDVWTVQSLIGIMEELNVISATSVARPQAVLEEPLQTVFQTFAHSTISTILEPVILAMPVVPQDVRRPQQLIVYSMTVTMAGTIMLVHARLVMPHAYCLVLEGHRLTVEGFAL